jgi:hypothetical protein
MAARKVRSREAILLAAIKKLNAGQLGRTDRLVVALQQDKSLSRWSPETIRGVLATLESEGHLKTSTAQSIVFSGSDRASYEKVASGIVRRWAPRNDLADPCVAKVGTARHGLRREGAWLFPDLVLYANPKRRGPGEVTKRVHAIEVETASGFGVPSVYQAFEQARGADYAWVFGIRRGHSDSHLGRIVRVATELRVGLVYIDDVTTPAKWVTKVEAGRRQVDPAERENFYEHCGIAAPVCGRGQQDHCCLGSRRLC